jgi:hypothetical protein
LIQKVLDEAQRGKRKKKRDRGERRRRNALSFAGADVTYLHVLHYVGVHASNLVSRLSYIGPLREHPRRFYESKEEIPATAGLRGEDAPQILFLKKDREFHRDVDRWLKDSGLARKTWCPTLHEDLFAVMIRDPITGSSVNFADTGFGLSQLLPLVVQAFHSPPGSIIFLEQPEIHLNPRLQCQLSNLFACIARSRKTVVVETHSEHLVLRLRVLIAEGKLKPDDVALYYVEREGARSSVRQIPIKEDGFIESSQWPRGFFEESLVEALRLARQSSEEIGE